MATETVQAARGATHAVLAAANELELDALRFARSLDDGGIATRAAC
jgi:hypothetical protein